MNKRLCRWFGHPSVKQPCNRVGSPGKFWLHWGRCVRCNEAVMALLDAKPVTMNEAALEFAQMMVHAKMAADMEESIARRGTPLNAMELKYGSRVH